MNLRFLEGRGPNCRKRRIQNKTKKKSIWVITFSKLGGTKLDTHMNIIFFQGSQTNIYLFIYLFILTINLYSHTSP